MADWDERVDELKWRREKSGEPEKAAGASATDQREDSS
jgi:hypothetical protein